jgi:hypothetical protein
MGRRLVKAGSVASTSRTSYPFGQKVRRLSSSGGIGASYQGLMKFLAIRGIRRGR